MSQTDAYVDWVEAIAVPVISLDECRAILDRTSPGCTRTDEEVVAIRNALTIIATIQLLAARRSE